MIETILCIVASVPFTVHAIRDGSLVSALIAIGFWLIAVLAYPI